MKIGIVGTGISGLVCAHLLHPHHDVTVFEADGRVGGHANTARVELVDPSRRHRGAARRHRVHRLQRAQLPELRPTPRPARRGHPARRDELQRERPGTRPRVPGHEPQHPVRPARQPDPALVPPHADRHPAVRPGRPPAAHPGRRGRRRRRHRVVSLEQFVRTGGYSDALRRAVPRPAGRVDLVGRSRHLHAVPRRGLRPLHGQPRPPAAAPACRSGARSRVGRSGTSTRSPLRSPIASVAARRCARSCAVTPATTASRWS